MKKIFLILAVLSLILPASSLALAQEVTASDLLKDPDRYNNTDIEFTGEAIGDVMRRGENAWIAVNDGEITVGVWASRDEAEQIAVLGDYRHTGDTLRIHGFFNKACEKHGGDFDIHAKEIELIRTGEERREPVPSWKYITSAFLLSICFILFFIGRFSKKDII